MEKDTDTEEKKQKPGSKITGIIIFLIVAAIFVGPRLMREYGVPSPGDRNKRTRV